MRLIFLPFGPVLQFYRGEKPGEAGMKEKQTKTINTADEYGCSQSAVGTETGACWNSAPCMSLLTLRKGIGHA